MNIYNNKFYNDQKNGSSKSAKIILPYIINILKPKSILDVGCGVGTWLKVANENNISDILGLDGSYVNKNELAISNNNFLASDLRAPPKINRRFDLVISLEVAEHLPQKDAIIFVSYLTKHSDYVLFSAAIPHQGGTSHINEQWQSYWQKIFEKQGYFPIDCIRPHVWNNKNVEWWYSQNTLLYVNKKVNLQPQLKVMRNKSEHNIIDIVHPSKLLSTVKTPTLKQVIYDFVSLFHFSWK